MYITSLVLVGALFAYIYFLGRNAYARLFIGILASALIVSNTPVVTTIAKQFLTQEARAYVYLTALLSIAAVCAWALSFTIFVRMGFVTRLLATTAGTISLAGLILALGYHVLSYSLVFKVPEIISLAITNSYAVPAWILVGILVYVVAYKE
jgi:hypothetical protein